LRSCYFCLALAFTRWWSFATPLSVAVDEL
jgi:hypothetical protein